MLNFIRWILFCVIATSVSLLLLFFAIPFLLLRCDKVVKLFSFSWAKTFIIIGRVICGIKTVVEGGDVLPSNKKFILASKHLSMWETVFFYQYFNGAVFVLKKEIFKIPFTSHIARSLGMISIDRSKGVSAITKIMNEIKNSVSLPLIIFPQGTRVRQLNKDYSLSKYPYKKGVVAMSKESQLPVYLVSHNASDFWGRGGFSFKKSGTITLRFHDFGLILKDNSDIEKISDII